LITIASTVDTKVSTIIFVPLIDQIIDALLRGGIIFEGSINSHGTVTVVFPGLFDSARTFKPKEVILPRDCSSMSTL
jgi:hypothetical protein